MEEKKRGEREKERGKKESLQRISRRVSFKGINDGSPVFDRAETSVLAECRRFFFHFLSFLFSFFLFFCIKTVSILKERVPPNFCHKVSGQEVKTGRGRERKKVEKRG